MEMGCFPIQIYKIHIKSYKVSTSSIRGLESIQLIVNFTIKKGVVSFP